MVVKDNKAIELTINRWDRYLYRFFGEWDTEKRTLKNGRLLFLEGDGLVDGSGAGLQPTQSSINQVMRALDKFSWDDFAV